MRTLKMLKEWGGHEAGMEVAVMAPGEPPPVGWAYVDAGRGAQLVVDGLAEWMQGGAPLPEHEAQLLGHWQAEPGAAAPTWTADSAKEAPGVAASAGEPSAQPQAPPDAPQGVPGAQEPPAGETEEPEGAPAPLTAGRKGGKG
jgi:hypothetical protein